MGGARHRRASLLVSAVEAPHLQFSMDSDIPSDVAAVLLAKSKIRVNGTPCKWILPKQKVHWALILS